jgi:hypothetical protein
MGPQEKDLITLTSYLYLGYTELVLQWLKHKGARNCNEAMCMLRPIIIKVVQDLNLSPRVFCGVKASELAANETIKFILENFKER